MQLLRALPALGACAIVAAVACSDSGPLQPDAARTTLGTSGQTDTSKSTAADNKSDAAEAGFRQDDAPDDEPRAAGTRHGRNRKTIDRPARRVGNSDRHGAGVGFRQLSESRRSDGRMDVG